MTSKKVCAFKLQTPLDKRKNSDPEEGDFNFNCCDATCGFNPESYLIAGQGQVIKTIANDVQNNDCRNCLPYLVGISVALFCFFGVVNVALYYLP